MPPGPKNWVEANGVPFVKPNDSIPGNCADALGTIMDMEIVPASTSAATNRRILHLLPPGLLPASAQNFRTGSPRTPLSRYRIKRPAGPNVTPHRLGIHTNVPAPHPLRGRPAAPGALPLRQSRPYATMPTPRAARCVRAQRSGRTTNFMARIIAVANQKG